MRACARVCLCVVYYAVAIASLSTDIDIPHMYSSIQFRQANTHTCTMNIEYAWTRHMNPSMVTLSCERCKWQWSNYAILKIKTVAPTSFIIYVWSRGFNENHILFHWFRFRFRYSCVSTKGHRGEIIRRSRVWSAESEWKGTLGDQWCYVRVCSHANKPTQSNLFLFTNTSLE